MQTCTNPDIRNLMLAYELGQLSEEEADRFERHLFECQACATEVVEDEPLIELLKAAIQFPSQSASSSLQKTGRPEIPLPVSAVYDRTRQELTAEYYGDFGVEELAASTETSAELSPIFSGTLAEKFMEHGKTVWHSARRGCGRDFTRDLQYSAHCAAGGKISKNILSQHISVRHL